MNTRELSGTLFAGKGHEVISCDFLETEQPGAHFQGNVFDIIDFPFDFAGFHFPCTDGSVSGAKHFEEKKLDGRYYTSAALWLKGWRLSRHIGGGYFEHPISVMSTLFRKPDQIIQPWMFGHYETKATCLWLWGVETLKPIYKTMNECREALGIEEGTPPDQRVWKMPPGKDRWKERSRTFKGVAQAMADQWGAAQVSDTTMLPTAPLLVK